MFSISSKLTGAVAPTEYYECTLGEAFQLGEALKMKSGKLTKASGADNVQFICIGEKRNDGFIPVIRVTRNIEFETKSDVQIATSLIGTVVTVSTDGLSVTATAESGVFNISYTDGGVRSIVRGYFI